LGFTPFLSLKLPQILNEIQEVVISKISNRFETVRKEVRLGRDTILRNAAEDIENMRLERYEFH
jgi:hypothetical protein